MDAREVIEWTDLNWLGTPGEIVGVGLLTSDTTGIELSDITFGADWVTFDITGSWASDSYALITLQVRHGVPDAGATLGLFAASLRRSLLIANSE